MHKLLALTITALLFAACGGNTPTPTPTLPPPTAAASTNAVETALAALKSEHQSWQYTMKTYDGGTPNFTRTVDGTEAPGSPSAAKLTITQSGKPDMSYVRLGTKVWFDSGTGSYTAATADDQYVNLDFEPLFFSTLVVAAENQGYEFDAVGPDTVNGTAATHYRMPESQVEAALGNSVGITPADWGADVWTSDADGSLLRLQWGPQSVENAQTETGFDYTVTALDCDCPIKPPTASS